MDGTNIYALKIKFLFDEIDLETLDSSTLRRIKMKGDTVKCFKSSYTGKYDLLNLYDSTSENAFMVDQLLEYRVGNIPDLDTLEYNSINYTLAKLIYSYLDLMVNGNIRDLDTTDTISSPESLVDTMFETYVINETHKLIKTYSVSLSSGLIETIPVRKKIVMDSTNLSSLEYTFDTPLPYDTDRVFLFHNGNTLDSTNYSLTLDSSSFNITIDNTSLMSLDDVLLIDYYTRINV